MRRFFYAALVALSLFGACKNDSGYQLGKPQINAVKFPPPVVKYDEETRTEAPMQDNLGTADPDVKSIEDHANNTPSPTEKKIIKEGSISFETNDLIATRKAIIDSLKKLGGYVGEEKEQNDDELQRKEFTLTTRIPAQNFDRFLSTVTTSADHIESKTITVKDVTTEYIDVTTRLNNQKLLENRYKELLQKASKMADVLEVESKLSEIRTNIEATQGQLNYLNKQVAYSSLDITFFVETPIKGTDGNGFGYRFKTALSESVALLQSIFFGLITSWPIVLIVIVLWFLFKRWKRKRRAANSQQ